MENKCYSAGPYFWSQHFPVSYSCAAPSRIGLGSLYIWQVSSPGGISEDDSLTDHASYSVPCVPIVFLGEVHVTCTYRSLQVL